MNAACLSDDVVFAYLGGSVLPEQAMEVERHLASCADCCTLVAETAKLLENQTDATRLDFRPPTMPSGPTPLTRGTKLGRYEILDVLGRGGMSVVYAAHDSELHRRIAIKVLLSESADARERSVSKSRLLREARAMAAVAHPNVVAIHDVGEWNDEVFVAMELVEGGTLRAWLAKGPHDWRSVVDVFLAAGEGLVAAHRAGLVHRDFKPENVLIGNDGRVRVTDFGIARTAHLGDAALEAPESEGLRSSPRPDLGTLTATGAASGTPAYMSPEQFRGQASDARTDQFAFCIALHEGLYGVRPFAGRETLAIAREVLAGRVVSPPLDRDVPAELHAILLRGLSLRIEDRFPSLADLLDALRASADAVAVAAPARGAPPGPPSPWRNVAVLLAGALLVFAPFAVWATFSSAASAKREPVPSAPAGELPSSAAPAAVPTSASAPSVTTEPRPDESANPAPPVVQAAKRGTPPRRTKAPGSKRVAPIGDKVENPF